MEKVKFGYSQLKQNPIEYKIKEAILSINSQLKTAMEAIGYLLTEETLQDCYSGAKKICDQYFERVLKDAEKINIPATRLMLEDNAREAWKAFNNSRQQVLTKISAAIRKYISVTDGFALITESSRNQLIEDCTLYLTDPEEIELYQLHLAACESLNNFFQGHHTPEWNRLFEWQDGKFSPALADYKFINSKIKLLKK